MIKEEIIQRADEYLQKLSDSDIEKYLRTISKEQKNIVDYVMSMGDIFEDEDEFFNKFLFFFMLVHRSYTNRFRFLPEITKDIILTIEERDQKMMDEMQDMDSEIFEQEFDELIKSHPQRMMIDFITLDLFESDEEQYDDNRQDLDNIIFFLMFTIINIYEESLVLSQKTKG
ncbi:MAG: hypothetical protein DRI86_11835 [Bacteroidetes bacterium]|nr:MAG: hypothetical protein DRI86_11835 [Bacteroidota bacterium]